MCSGVQAKIKEWSCDRESWCRGLSGGVGYVTFHRHLGLGARAMSACGCLFRASRRPDMLSCHLACTRVHAMDLGFLEGMSAVGAPGPNQANIVTALRLASGEGLAWLPIRACLAAGRHRYSVSRAYEASAQCYLCRCHALQQIPNDAQV